MCMASPSQRHTRALDWRTGPRSGRGRLVSPSEVTSYGAAKPLVRVVDCQQLDGGAQEAMIRGWPPPHVPESASPAQLRHGDGVAPPARPPVRPAAARGAVEPECVAASAAGCADVEECCAAPAAVPPWADAHAAALARGEHTYTDPGTGYSVFTTAGLLAQKTCCGSGCRHCPYGYLHCPPSQPKRLPHDAVLLFAAPRQRRARAVEVAAVQHTGCVAWAPGAHTWSPGTLVVLPFQASGGAVLSLADAGPDSTDGAPHLFQIFDALKAAAQDSVAVPIADGEDARHAVDAALLRLRLPSL